MRRRPSTAFAVALAVSLAYAQSAVLAQQPPPQPAPQQQPGISEGFFRPTGDTALTRLPDPVPATRNAPVTPVIDAQTLEAQRGARELAERELDRAAREHREAQATVPAPRPIVISPLDGTAPITSPLDGTANILSPIGR